jgi:heptosyltransferase III
MRLKAGVFGHNGLGDGINTLVLSNNLHLNGYEVVTYHNMIGSMQNWFPHLPVETYPPLEDLHKILHAHDWYFVVWNDSSEFTKQLIQEGKRRFPERVKVIYLYPSRNIMNELYYTDCLIDPTAPIAHNLRMVCEKVLHLPKSTKHAGLIIPTSLSYKKYPKRIVIHPTSGRPGKNWPKDKYVKLALHLKSEGFFPIFIPGSQEMAGWNDLTENDLEMAHFHTLDELAAYLYESGYLIGNDSGLGHLASALNIPTMTFCRRKALAKMWAPSFIPGIVLTPSSLIPNIRGLRLRDQYWHRFITVNMARRGFERLLNL